MNMIQTKPLDSKWTDEQWRAITERGNHVLVAAAAGSGKTAVLVERIIRLISNEEKPVDVDRLLVATFTKAAASEMKQRIREALENELHKQPFSLYLRRQLLLLNQASISTIHSFCMDVIKRYTYLLDLDPAFRIADESEARILRQEVIDELFEEWYGTSDEDSPFFTLVEWYGSDRDDAGLKQLVERLYDFAMSHPWPEHWLDEKAAMYQVKEGIELESLPWVHDIKQELQFRLQRVLNLLQKGMELCKHPGGPLPYLDNLNEEYLKVEELLRLCQGSWQDLHHAFQVNPFGKLKPCKGDHYDKELQEKVQDLRNKAKDEIKAIKEGLFKREPKEILSDLVAMAPLMQELVHLVKSFANRYAEAKREKALVDFSDLEHYCLKILLHPDSTPECPLPSEVALQYREHFVEILVDEYQDTNLVQETILHLISRESNGNRFMVGDVKQSIYRFRLTEPKLFLDKYKSYRPEGGLPGSRIDLANNFRSRKEILAGTNYIFRQIMHESAAEIDYDENAELRFGAEDYPPLESNPIEVYLIDRTDPNEQDDGKDAEGENEDGGPLEGESAKDEELESEELETAQLEARLIAAKIKEYIRGPEGGTPLQVYDRKLKEMRNIQYRDIVILLRSTRNWASLFLEEFRSQGIPAYTEESGGYFAATEIEVMLSLLRIIDNPYQDIPLAAVLRSPIMGLSADQLAMIRIGREKCSYYEALLHFLRSDEPDTAVDPVPEREAIEVKALKEKLGQFLQRLEAWRTEARQGSLSSLIWQIYRETGYYDYVGGLPGGSQRQANLRILYDRALQFEQTSFRGLYRFLRFVERMQDRGDDMGTARTLGEQEDVVRIMTIHKSKGLEFPLVFVTGIGKQFNLQDVRANFLYHKELGFGSHFVDLALRVSFPTLPQLAIKRRILAETLAEEMRLLYVALTRAKEKCILVGTSKNLSKQVEKWGEALSIEDWQLPAHLLTKALSYLEWIGYSLIRHQDAKLLRERYLQREPECPAPIRHDSSQWNFCLYSPKMLSLKGQENVDENRDIWDAIQGLREINIGDSFDDHHADQQLIHSRLTWTYPYPLEQRHLAKQSVSELKRKLQIFTESEESLPALYFAPVFPRPKFMEQKGLNAAERGTLMHLVMQQLLIQPPMDVRFIEAQVSRMIDQELLTPEQATEVDVASIAEFFQTELGSLYFSAEKIHREIPFSLALPAAVAYPDWIADGAQVENETVLVQGIIDCLLEMKEGFILVDYKTDQTVRFSDEDLLERYRVQINLYGYAVERIMKVPLLKKVLYFFDGKRIVEVI